MGETKGASENLIVFIPQPINEQNNFHKKVFAATELEQIFQNDMLQTINGIPKEQTELLKQAIIENGSLTSESNIYTVNKCYDENDKFVGVELISKNQEQSLIEAPESTLRKEGFQSSIQKSGKEIDILQPKTKTNLFKDTDGTICIGSKPKLTISKGLNGELTVGIGTIKDSAKQFDKVLNNGKSR